ncbi:Hypothetical_protein [Hexamita inflata]|uniref:Hypothetical_protein n=1 Tax=Hexamita inflata TaxID=28002 RepID=A0AA86PFN3_9EUKA|nr:Hypothetical protein HINF_LOCUS24143 [Hexamita inflata]
MGCTIETQSPIPVKDWFQAAIENNLSKIQQLKGRCLFSYYNGMCALHYAIIYNSYDVFLELLQDESLLVTNSQISLFGKQFNSNSNILQLAITCDYLKYSKFVLDYFQELSDQKLLSSSQHLLWFLNNVKENCAPLILHPLFCNELNNAASDQQSIYRSIHNQILFDFLISNKEIVPQNYNEVFQITENYNRNQELENEQRNQDQKFQEFQQVWKKQETLLHSVMTNELLDE